MAKSKKVQAAGVAVFADGRILHRLQSVSADTDLGVDEIREISNDGVVEFVEGIPTVSISLEANMWGSRKNIVALAAVEGTRQVQLINGGTWDHISHKSFDGTSVDLVMHVEEDGVLKRSVYMGDCFLTSISFNFDVGGVATESYSLEADNKIWYLNDYREIVVLSGYHSDVAAVVSGVYYSSNYPVTYFLPSGFCSQLGDPERFVPLFITADGEKVVDTNGADVTLYGNASATDPIVWIDPTSTYWTQVSGVSRIRIVGYKVTPSTTISAGITERTGTTGVIGGIRKGMVEIFLVSGAVSQLVTGTTDKFLRLQSCSIDADLSREALEELGNYKAYDRSLTYPISATVNFSALASDLEAWAKFSSLSKTYVAGTLNKIEFRDFVRDAGVIIKIYSDDETNTSRAHLMTITASGVRVASESFGADVGGNATQDFSCSVDNFTVS